jgi:2',3'-cyclic-nucleotide 2'-phosphodiesterase (5'-nucleotidase family)
MKSIQKLCRLPLLFIVATFFSSWSLADTRLTIIHTSDLHSHFTNRQSKTGFGGFARVKTKIDQIRGQNPNSLLLDAGDWSEGNLFFTLDSGAQTQMLLQKFQYDAMVLGNHDWLVGPNELYDAFIKAGAKTPVISANLNFQNLSPQVPLNEVIKPYVIKWVGGKKVAILGLSTFQVIYDHFFAPVRLVDPVTTATRYVEYLRGVENCDVVIALSHLGFGQDKILATLVPGIDAIVGGHTHLLLKKPHFQNGVPVFHIGKWGEFVGQYDLNISNSGYVSLVKSTIHQVDESVTPDPEIAALVGESQQRLERQFGGPIFNDHVVFTEVDLKIAKDLYSNDWMGQVNVDALREAGRTDIAFDTPMFASTGLFSGWNHTSDLFDVFPHVFNNKTQRSWTVLTYQVNGFVLRSALALFVKAKIPLKMSNLEILVDHRQIEPVAAVKIGGEPLSLLRYYSVSSTRGVLDVFLQLRERGLPIGPKTWQDTGQEAWRVFAQKMKSLSPITRDSLTWKNTVSSVQPDLAILPEFVETDSDSETMRIQFRVFNSGLLAAPIPKAQLMIDLTPRNALDENWQTLTAVSLGREIEIAGGSEVIMEAVWPLKAVVPAALGYPMKIEVQPVVGEKVFTNNKLETILRTNQPELGKLGSTFEGL